MPRVAFDRDYDSEGDTYAPFRGVGGHLWKWTRSARDTSRRACVNCGYVLKTSDFPIRPNIVPGCGS